MQCLAICYLAMLTHVVGHFTMQLPKANCGKNSLWQSRGEWMKNGNWMQMLLMKNMHWMKMKLQGKTIRKEKQGLIACYWCSCALRDGEVGSNNGINLSPTCCHFLHNHLGNHGTFFAILFLEIFVSNNCFGNQSWTLNKGDCFVCCCCSF